MKKLLVCLFFLLMIVSSFAQCPLSVSIKSFPDFSNTPICKGTPVLLTAVQSLGAISPIYYWVINGDTTLGTDSTFSILANNQTINLIMSTTTGCSPDSAFDTLQVQTVLIQETVMQLNYDCILDVGDIQVNQTGGSNAVIYNLQGIGTDTTGIFNQVPIGAYILFMVDAAGCKDTGEVIVVHIQNIESTPILIGPECNEKTADVTIFTTGDNPPFNYELVSIGSGSSDSYPAVPVGNYTLYSTDDKGCKDTNEVDIIPFECDPPIPSETITPNDDGYNDMWIINNIKHYPDNEVFIFDRWGQRVYHKQGYDNLDGWQAKYVGADMPVSTYYYILKITLEENDDLVFKGAISVFR